MELNRRRFFKVILGGLATVVLSKISKTEATSVLTNPAELPIVSLVKTKTPTFITSEKELISTFGKPTLPDYPELTPKILSIIREYYPSDIAKMLCDVQPLSVNTGQLFTLKPRLDSDINLTKLKILWSRPNEKSN